MKDTNRRIQSRRKTHELPKPLEKAMRVLGKTLLYPSLIAVSDALGLLLSFGFVSGPSLVLILFLEGGTGLVLGVAISLSSTPSMTKLGEALFGATRWSREAEKHAERVGLRWMLASSFLTLIGFIVSLV